MKIADRIAKRVDDKYTPVGHYVYALVCPSTDIVFYIGKGKDKRFLGHTWAVKSGREKNIDKANIIKEILDCGLTPAYFILQEGMDSFDASQLERDIIEKIGLDNLTNLNKGGAGGAERFRSHKLQQRRAGELLMRIDPDKIDLENSMHVRIILELLEMYYIGIPMFAQITNHLNKDGSIHSQEIKYGY